MADSVSVIRTNPNGSVVVSVNGGAPQTLNPATFKAIQSGSQEAPTRTSAPETGVATTAKAPPAKEETAVQNYVQTANTNTAVPVSKGVAQLIARKSAEESAAQTSAIAEAVKAGQSQAQSDYFKGSAGAVGLTSSEYNAGKLANYGTSNLVLTGQKGSLLIASPKVQADSVQAFKMLHPEMSDKEINAAVARANEPLGVATVSLADAFGGKSVGEMLQYAATPSEKRSILVAQQKFDRDIRRLELASELNKGSKTAALGYVAGAEVNLATMLVGSSIPISSAAAGLVSKGVSAGVGIVGASQVVGGASDVLAGSPSEKFEQGATNLAITGLSLAPKGAALASKSAEKIIGPVSSAVEKIPSVRDVSTSVKVFAKSNILPSEREFVLGKQEVVSGGSSRPTLTKDEFGSIDIKGESFVSIKTPEVLKETKGWLGTNRKVEQVRPPSTRGIRTEISGKAYPSERTVDVAKRTIISEKIDLSTTKGQMVIPGKQVNRMVRFERFKGKFPGESRELGQGNMEGIEKISRSIPLDEILKPKSDVLGPREGGIPREMGAGRQRQFQIQKELSVAKELGQEQIQLQKQALRNPQRAIQHQAFKGKETALTGLGFQERMAMRQAQRSAFGQPQRQMQMFRQPRAFKSKEKESLLFSQPSASLSRSALTQPSAQVFKSAQELSRGPLLKNVLERGKVGIIGNLNNESKSLKKAKGSLIGRSSRGSKYTASIAGAYLGLKAKNTSKISLGFAPRGSLKLPKTKGGKLR